MPNSKRIKRWLKEYRARGINDRKKKTGNKLARTEQQETAIVEFFHENPTISVRDPTKLTIEQENVDDRAIDGYVHHLDKCLEVNGLSVE